MGIFVSQFDLETPGELTWDDLVEGMNQIRETLSGVAKNATEFDSYNDMQDERFKHRRMKKDPMDKSKAPMTDSMAIGWHEEEVFNERFAKNSCAETRYADAMQKCGVDIF